MIEHLQYAVKNEARLKSDFFSPYTGRYQITPNYIQTITKEGSGIFVETSRRGKYRIYPVSDTKFTFMNYDMVLTFVKNEDGTIEELITESQVNNRRAKKID